VDRRLGGLALLALACLTLIVLPNIHGRPVSGSAIPTYVPPPPQVGQCVTSLKQVQFGTEQPDDTPIAYPTISYGSCDSAVMGEVMSVDPTGLSAAGLTIGTYQTASSSCELDEVNYVGSIGPFDLTNPNVPSIAWQAAVTIQSVSIGPSPLQRGAGQSWTACVGTTSDDAAYRGRIVNALTRGSLPAAFATCWGSLPASTQLQTDTPVESCAAPHAVEILGTTQITDPATTAAEVQRTCEGFAKRALRTTDPTRGGAVRIEAFSMDGASVMPLTSVQLTSGFLGCLAKVDPPHQLLGTLIGLGDHAAPITG
jgi:hypothetical protein